MRSLWYIAAACLVMAACTESFNPIAEGERPFAVFAVMNSGLDTQVARVHASESPSVDDPGYPEVPGASVVVSHSGGSWTFRDTLMSMPGGTVTAYFLANFVPELGTTYQLTVTTDVGVATASTTVPSSSAIFSDASYVLREPKKYPSNELIASTVALAPEAYGYVVRLVVEYEVDTGSGWMIKHEEVPLLFRTGADPLYPEPKRRRTTVAYPGSPQTREAALFTNREYSQALRNLYGSGMSIRMRRALFIVSQTDQHLFTYYNIANGFRDPGSIRLDRPDYSNMTGALGVFGSLTSDTLAIALPPYVEPRSSE